MATARSSINKSYQGRNPSSRNWCFTSWTLTESKEENPLGLTIEENALRYYCYQLEMSPETRKLHYQGYLEFAKPLRMKRLKSILCDQEAHVEPRWGTREEARDYCRKEESRVRGPWDGGDWNAGGAGSRVDILTATRRIAAGEITHQNARNEIPDLMVRYRNGIQDFLGASMRSRSSSFRQLQVKVYYGAAGSGKTRKAVEDNPGAYILDQASDGSRIWFDGYEGETAIIVDDYYGWMRWTFLLRFLDGYQLRLPVKGGFTWALYTTVIFTSNTHPKNWYNYSETMSKDALKRRINEIWLFRVDEAPTLKVGEWVEDPQES